MRDDILRLILDVVAQQDADHLEAQARNGSDQLSRLADQLISDIGDLAVLLFHKYINVFVSFKFSHVQVPPIL